MLRGVASVKWRTSHQGRGPDDITDPTAYADRKTERWVATMRPTWLLGVNQSTIFTATNPETTQRSKHLEIRWFRIRDYVSKKFWLYCDSVRSRSHLQESLNTGRWFSAILLHIGVGFARWSAQRAIVSQELLYFQTDSVVWQLRTANRAVVRTRLRMGTRRL